MKLIVTPDPSHSRDHKEVFPLTDPKMTLHEMTEALRANGVPATESRLREMAIAGKFPFAFGVRGDGRSGRATILIFRHAFYAWLDEMLGCESIRI